MHDIKSEVNVCCMTADGRVYAICECDECVCVQSTKLFMTICNEIIHHHHHRRRCHYHNDPKPPQIPYNYRNYGRASAFVAHGYLMNFDIFCSIDLWMINVHKFYRGSRATIYLYYEIVKWRTVDVVVVHPLR